MDASPEEKRRIQNSINALRHGLTTVRRANPVFAPEITAIAESMCGRSDGGLYDKALLVAECDVTIAQIRRYKRYLLTRMLDPNCLPTTHNKLEFRKRAVKLREMWGIGDKLIALPRSRSDPAYGDFALHMTELWGSPGGIELEVVRALPDILKISRYETKIWRMRRRRFREFLAAKSGPV